MLCILLWLAAALIAPILIAPIIGGRLHQRFAAIKAERWRQITHWQELTDRAEIERGGRMLK